MLCQSSSKLRRHIWSWWTKLQESNGVFNLKPTLKRTYSIYNNCTSSVLSENTTNAHNSIIHWDYSALTKLPWSVGMLSFAVTKFQRSWDPTVHVLGKFTGFHQRWEKICSLNKHWNACNKSECIVDSISHAWLKIMMVKVQESRFCLILQ